MTYTFTKDFGAGIILAPCLQTLCAEIAQHYPDAVNLGEIGNAAHVTEGYGSDHNPFIVHNGKRYVRAIDIGGPDSIQAALFDFIQARYQAHDSRVWPYGYVHRNGVITTWFGTGTHPDAGDEGHLHISVTQANGNHPSPTGWVSALDRTDGWGLVTPTTKDWFDMATKQDLVDLLQPLNDKIDGLATTLLYGDSREAAMGAKPQTHAFNLFQMKQELDAIKTKVGA